MDEDFAFFLENFGPAFDRREVPEASLNRYRGKLPEQMLAYWQEHGWCGYAEGLFWTVNPEDYEALVDMLLEGTELAEQDRFHVLAKGAFGRLYLWGEATAGSLIIETYLLRYRFKVRENLQRDLNFAAKFFFSTKKRDINDFSDYFEPALKKFGRLAYDELYGFVPAYPLGGSLEFNTLQRLKDVEHLMFLAQLDRLESYNFPPFPEVADLIR